MPPHPQYFQLPMTPAAPAPPLSTTRPHLPAPSLPRKPLLRLEVRDLSSKGSRAFLSLSNPGIILEDAVNAVLLWLYAGTSPSKIPPTRSITLILRDMGGVAYTTGSELDSDHKEIHFSTGYIEGIPKERREAEILGVITHEMVHCWQWAAKGTCPGGLIEGIADYVRLRAGFAPPHWKKESGGQWDAGYQHTGYFLDYLEKKFGEGTVIKINERLRDRDYVEEDFWQHCCGSKIEPLWEEYGKHLNEGKKKKKEDEQGEEQKKDEMSVGRDQTPVDLLKEASLVARKVYQTLLDTPEIKTEIGVHVQDLALQLQMDIAEVRKVGLELIELGAIYTTVDDDHWQSTTRVPMSVDEPTDSRFPPDASLAASKVYDFLLNRPKDKSDEGTRIEIIARGLQMDVEEVRKIGDELLEMGVMYCTVDDDHWALLWDKY